MNDTPEKTESALPDESPSGRTTNWTPISFWRLGSKELRETLRDRRTIGTLFLMPLIVYPILSLLFQGFIASGFKQQASAPTESLGGVVQQEVEGDQYLFLFDNEDDFNRVAPILNNGYLFLQGRRALHEDVAKELEAQGNPEEQRNTNLFRKHIFQAADPSTGLTLKQLVSQGLADVGVVVSQTKDEQGRDKPADFTLYYQDSRTSSVEALRLFENILDSVTIGAFQGALARRGVASGAPVNIKAESLEPPPSKKNNISFAAIIPLVLTLMTITGAVYPAIDLTAGERERGTLESLIAAPIPRMRILLGKLIAIVSVAMLTAIVNLIGMSITLWVFQFDKALFGEQGLTIETAGRILGLLILFAIFFSSILLVITSFARSFKEGQAYLIPVMMVALAPSLMSLKPDLELQGLWTVTPLVNIVLLARDVLSNTATWQNAVVTVGTTILYSLLALTLAARFFGTAKVLYGTDQGIGSIFKRPRNKRPYACLLYTSPSPRDS